MLNEKNNRLLEFLKSKGYNSPKELFNRLSLHFNKEKDDKLDISYESIRKFFNEKLNLKDEKIKYLLSPFNDYSLNYILYGELEGKSFDSNYAKIDGKWQVVQEEPENFNIVQEEKFKPVPYYNVDFSGGWSSEDVFANVRPDFFINNPEFQRSDFACNLVGKSISSIIPDGAVVGFKVIDDWKTYFPQNELYGIITKNEFRTVKIVRRNKENNTLILVPAPSSEFSERFCTEEEIPEEYVIKFFQVIAYAFYERLVI